jgi:hypothetical protein
MQLHFKVTGMTEPNKWFELYLDHMATGIYYPAQEWIDYYANPVCYGIDLDCEINKAIYDELNEMFTDIFDDGTHRTRFEIALAVSAIESQLREKCGAFK